jgi:hypothetical protein
MSGKPLGKFIREVSKMAKISPSPEMQESSWRWPKCFFEG